MKISWIIVFLLSISISVQAYYCEPWGSDAGISFHQKPKKDVEDAGLAVRVADGIIRFHQTVINPADGPRSHFRPSSSRYMQLAMQRYGFIKGFLMGCDRLLRENDEEWVYQTIDVDGNIYKFDPAWDNKYLLK